MIFIERTLHGKPYFPFCWRPEKMVFLKKLCWNIIFLALLGKMIFLFPENMILYLRRKMKDDLSQKKIDGNMIFSLNLLKRWSFQEGPRRHMIFLVSSGEMVFFSPKTYFSPSSGNTWKFDIFCILVRVLQACHHTPPSKKIYQFSVLSWWPLRAFSCIAP